MKWRTFASRARYAFGAYAATEGCAFGAHQYRINQMHHAPRRSMEEGFDYDGHFRWFSSELRHEPNPRRLFEDAFNAAPIATIPRANALHMLQFYLTARERDEFPNDEYPTEVTKAAESLLRGLEKRHGLTFAGLDSETSMQPRDASARDPNDNAFKRALMRVSNRTKNDKAYASEESAVREFLVDGGGGSQGGVETKKNLKNQDDDVDFIRPNRFDMHAYYKPIAFQALIAAFRASSDRRLKRGGFEKKRDPGTNIAVWVRYPRPLSNLENERDASSAADAERYEPIVFLHGLGIGLAPYAEYVCSLPDHRPVVAPEWPNISYSWDDRSDRYPSPSEIAHFLERSTKRAAEDAVARDVGSDPKMGAQDVIVRAVRNVKCDVIAHSYGTVCLTSFRRHYPKSIRRRVYVDPVCFLPSFGSYLRYGFDDHLTNWWEMVGHLAKRANDPSEVMSFGNLILASWFVKGDASTQQLMKRLLFPHEAWERGPLTRNDAVVLSGLDEIVGANEISERFQKAWPRCKVYLQEQWQHGGFMLEPDPEGVNDAIVAHVTGGKFSRVDRKKPGLVKRAWRAGFAKRRKKKSKISEDERTEEAETGKVAAAAAA
jgi:pimeloyl-ACP methyl ester carboxylesterase